MKKSVFIIIFFLILPIIFAEMDIRQDMDKYNLGDKISVSASVIEDRNVDGFFKAGLECPNYAIQYFVRPISLEKDFRTSINVPKLTATKEMIGNCKIKAVLEESDGTIDTGYTDEFKVKNELDISCECVETMPGKEVEIFCTARKLSSELVPGGTAKLNYRGRDYTANVGDGMFSFIVFIASDSPAGMQKMAIEIEDGKGNYGDLIFEVDVEAIPTKLENTVNKESFKPHETIDIRPALYDHIGDLINATIRLEFIDTKDKKIISKDVVSGEIASYIFNSFALPGDYKIRSYSKGLTKESSVKVESLSKLEMTYTNEKVLVKNVGNVIYNNKTTIVLENDEGKYLIEKKIKLKPTETIEIDLSKEVPYGYYNIVLPEGSVKDGETEAASVVENVELHDNRPVYKKVGTGVREGFDAITGAAAATIGFISARPLAASIILIVITLVIVLFYSKDFIKSRLERVKVKMDKKEAHTEEEKYTEERKDTEERKESDELEGLFKDFEYGKE